VGFLNPVLIYYRFIYQAVVLPGHAANNKNAPLVIIDGTTPPILVNPDRLGGADAVGKVFTIGVRLKTLQVSVELSCSECSFII
jgi:hypothetical protein